MGQFSSDSPMQFVDAAQDGKVSAHPLKHSNLRKVRAPYEVPYDQRRLLHETAKDDRWIAALSWIL